MPSSRIENVAPIMFIAEQLRPTSILDVGPGYGKYGMLMRERVDDFQGRVRIDAVDVFPDYNKRASKASGHPAAHDLYACLYNNYAYGDYLKLGRYWLEVRDDPDRQRDEPRREYDLILLVGVLEHWNDDEASAVLDVSTRLGKNVLIETPLNYPQGASHGNIREAHLSEWPHDRLVDWARDHGCTWNPHTRRPRGPEDTVIGVMRRKQR